MVYISSLTRIIKSSVNGRGGRFARVAFRVSRPEITESRHVEQSHTHEKAHAWRRKPTRERRVRGEELDDAHNPASLTSHPRIIKILVNGSRWGVVGPGPSQQGLCCGGVREIHRPHVGGLLSVTSMIAWRLPARPPLRLRPRAYRRFAIYCSGACKQGAQKGEVSAVRKFPTSLRFVGVSLLALAVDSFFGETDPDTIAEWLSIDNE